MTKATGRTASATRRSSGTNKSEPNGHRSPDEQDTRREQDLTVEHDERDLRNEQDLRDEQDEQDEQIGERGDKRLRREQDLTDERDERDPRDEQDKQVQHGEQDWRRDARRQPDYGQRTGVGSDRDQLEQLTDWIKPGTTTAVDALGPVFGVWRQVFTSWFELVGVMVKLQQQTFASLLGAADSNTERITNGDHRDRDHDNDRGDHRDRDNDRDAVSASASRTSSKTPDQIEHDRRNTGEQDEYQLRPGRQHGRQPAGRAGALSR